MKMLITVITLTFLTLSFACDDKGPVEQAAEEVNEGIEDIQAGGDTLENKLDDAVDELRDDAKEAKEKLLEK
jgi:vacuolar-type H+-ATPase subunit I/STV1